MPDIKRIAGISGGKDSTAMLVRLCEIGEPPDIAMFVDTGLEFDEIYNNIRKLKSFCEKYGCDFVTLKPEHDFEYYMFEYQKKKGKSKGQIGNGFPSLLQRWCNHFLKQAPSRRYFKKYGNNYILYIGFALNESKRLQKANNAKENMRFPLIEWGWDEDKCLAYCYEKGFDFDGYYKKFKRGGLRILYNNYPDRWNQLKEWEHRLVRESEECPWRLVYFRPPIGRGKSPRLTIWKKGFLMKQKKQGNNRICFRGW